MIAELGQVFLLLALAAAALQSVAPFVGAAGGDARLMAFGRQAALAQVLFVGLAFAALTILHATSDFSVRNVVENSHSAKPFVYKLTGVWGNHEGSMLLWILILSGYGGALAATARAMTPLRARALGVQGLVAVAFLAFLIFTSNPFARVFPAPADGQDLNPLLQDPGLIVHPPFLYLGYVGFSLTFAYAAAGLIGGRLDEAWAREVRPWALAAWTFLTIGIGLGSWWAYYELGWGGFWAWDPVENASFMPWLAGTALIHSVRALEVRGAFRAWTAFLAILAFSLSLVGTFLVRSGLLTSVHAFAVDPARGVFILGILALAIGGSLALFALRGPSLAGAARFEPVSREGGLLANNVLLVVSCATVFVGTFYPLFAEVTANEKLSVGAPYFNLVFAPIVFLMLLIVAPASALAWKRGRLGETMRRLWPAALAALAMIVLALTVYAPRSWIAALGAGLAIWAGAATLADVVRRARLFERGGADRFAGLPRSYKAMAIAHAGLAVLTLGVLGAGVWKSETIVYAREGDTLEVGGYAVRLASVTMGQGPNYETQVARFEVMDGDRVTRVLDAEKRFYPVRGMQTTEAGIRTTMAGDLYLTVGDFNPERGYVVRAWAHPLTVWMWIGAGLMAMGGVVAATGDGRRAPKREAAPASGRRTGGAGAPA